VTVHASGEPASLRAKLTKREFLRGILKSVIDELNKTPSEEDPSFSRDSRLDSGQMTKSYNTRDKEQMFRFLNAPMFLFNYMQIAVPLVQFDPVEYVWKRVNFR